MTPAKPKQIVPGYDPVRLDAGVAATRSGPGPPPRPRAARGHPNGLYRRGSKAGAAGWRGASGAFDARGPGGFPAGPLPSGLPGFQVARRHRLHIQCWRDAQATPRFLASRHRAVYLRNADLRFFGRGVRVARKPPAGARPRPAAPAAAGEPLQERPYLAAAVEVSRPSPQQLPLGGEVGRLRRTVRTAPRRAAPDLQGAGGQCSRIAVRGRVAPRAARPVQRPRPRYRDPGSVGKDRRRRDRASEPGAQTVHQIPGEHGVRGQRDEEGRVGKLVERGAGRCDAYARVRSEHLDEPGASFVIGVRRFDSDHQIVDPIRQDVRSRRDGRLGLVAAGLESHHILRRRVAATGSGAADLVMGDQVRQSSVLDPAASVPGVCALRQTALVPGPGVPDRNQQPTARMSPVAELGVLASPARERFVAPPHQPVEAPAHSEVAPQNRMKQVVGPRRQIPGSAHQAL